jgi:hypothetical protein
MRSAADPFNPVDTDRRHRGGRPCCAGTERVPEARIHDHPARVVAQAYARIDDVSEGRT